MLRSWNHHSKRKWISIVTVFQRNISKAFNMNFLLIIVIYVDPPDSPEIAGLETPVVLGEQQLITCHGDFHESASPLSGKIGQIFNKVTPSLPLSCVSLTGHHFYLGAWLKVFAWWSPGYAPVYCASWHGRRNGTTTVWGRGGRAHQSFWYLKQELTEIDDRCHYQQDRVCGKLDYRVPKST